MENQRHKDVNWRLPNKDTLSVEFAQLAVLMDIRDELQKLNSKLCRAGIEQFRNDINRIDRRLERNGFLVTKPRKKA